MLMCDETVTLVHLADEAYTMAVIRGVSWYAKAKLALEGKGLTAAHVVTVRIPAENLPPGAVLRGGDHLLRGEAAGPIGTPADLAKYEGMKILTVGDNRRGGLPHWVVTGE